MTEVSVKKKGNRYLTSLEREAKQLSSKVMFHHFYWQLFVFCGHILLIHDGISFVINYIFPYLQGIRLQLHSEFSLIISNIYTLNFTILQSTSSLLLQLPR